MKLYEVFLENELIGTTQFEKADAPMGVIQGSLEFKGVQFDYDYFKTYCGKNQIELTLDDSEEKAIITMAIHQLKVKSQEGKNIDGQGAYIEGIEREGFEITVFGYPYPDYENEFPNHVREYAERFKT